VLPGGARGCPRDRFTAARRFEQVVDDLGRTWFKTVDEDPAFAAIRAADVKHCWAVERLTVAENQFG
jgi:hypothetical protein